MRRSDLSPEDAELVAAAVAVRERAFAPYSDYFVGAALRAEDGTIVPGCNCEHIVFQLSCCAEQVAIHTAVAAGHRRFSAVAVVTNSSPPAAPCGACRQVLHAWGVPRALLANVEGEVREVDLRQLLPLAFEYEPPESR